MSDWGTTTLTNLGELARGKSKHRPRNDPKLFGGDYPFIQTSDVKHANYFINSFEETYNETGLAQSKLWPKNTLCITIAANIAESAVLNFPACFPDSVVGFIEDSDKSDVRFIKYALDYYKKRYQQRSQGAAQDNLSLEKIESLKLKVPSVSVQRKIAGVIFAYDSMIENNKKRIKILEEMAQRLYTEWFVKFKFPGHEIVKMVDSGTEFGRIPAGWEVSKLSDVCAYISRGISPKYDDYAESIVINQRCIRNQKLDLEQARKQSKNVSVEKLIKFGDVLINSTGVGTLGRVTQIYDSYTNCTVDSHVSIVRFSDSESFDYLGIALLNLEVYFSGMGMGATGQTELSRATIQNTNILYPPLNIQREFSGIISYLRRLCVTFLKTSKVLGETRDLLIPQLVTGKRILN